MEQKIRPKTIGLYLLLGASYFLLLLSFVAISISLDLRHERERFAETTHDIHRHLEALTSRSLIALQGFAALVQVEGHEDREKISAYVGYVRLNQPYIKALGIVREVPREALDAVIAEQKRAGFADFQPRTFSFEGSREWRPVGDQPDFYLLTFVEPMQAESLDLLGLDLGATPVLREAMKKSLTTQGPVASKPFGLVQGDMGVMLIRPVQRTGEQLFALIICRMSSLFPVAIPDQDSLSVGVHYDGRATGHDTVWLIRRASEAQPRFASRLFPTLSATRPVGGPEQLFMLKIDKRLDWRIVNWDMLVSILAIGLMLLPLLLAYAKAHHRSELRRLDEGNKLFLMANFDALTGLPNRQLFLNRLEQALAVAQRQGLRLAVLYLDLDGFKNVNDYYGHAVGDKVLQWAARIFLRCVREMDTVARLGGDEFVILLQDVAGQASGEFVARKIKTAFLQHSSEGSKLLPSIGVSIGVAVYPDDGKSAMELLRAADQAMYLEKAASKALTDFALKQHRVS